MHINTIWNAFISIFIVDLYLYGSEILRCFIIQNIFIHNFFFLGHIFCRCANFFGQLCTYLLFWRFTWSLFSFSRSSIFLFMCLIISSCFLVELNSTSSCFRFKFSWNFIFLFSLFTHQILDSIVVSSLSRGRPGFNSPLGRIYFDF